MLLAPELEQFVGKRAARRQIVEAIAASSHAFSADELWKTLRASTSKISRATLYRTIRGLCERGLLRETGTRSGVRLYQLASDTRKFLCICDDCGQVRSAACPSVTHALVAVSKMAGFHPADLTVEVHLRCEFKKRGVSCPDDRSIRKS